eukprot:625306-Prymnesium_polylepis.1
MIIEFAGAEVKKLAQEAGLWDQMSPQQQQEATEAYVGDCMQHIRNIILDPMAAAAESMLKGELEESLEGFSAFERMSTDAMHLIRAVSRSPFTKNREGGVARAEVPLSGFGEGRRWGSKICGAAVYEQLLQTRRLLPVPRQPTAPS